MSGDSRNKAGGMVTLPSTPVETDEVRVVASVSKVSTLVDGGIVVSFDLPEQAIEQAAWLMEAKRQGEAVELTMRRLS